MATPLNLPKLGVSMVEATLVGWLVADGGAVSTGEPVCTFETDKVEIEVEAPATGRLVHRAVAGELYEVGDPLAVII